MLNENYTILDIRYFPWVTRIFFETTTQLPMMWDKRNFRDSWSGNNARKALNMPDELKAAAELFPEFGVCRSDHDQCRLDVMDNFTVSCTV